VSNKTWLHKSAKLALALSRANGDVELIASLKRIQQEMQRTLSEIRELAQGIHPSVLRDHGLYAAVEDRCSRLPVTVSINATAELIDRRFSDDTEAAAYFTVSESVANVVKHAEASAVRIDIAEEKGFVRVEVIDDGRGYHTERVNVGSGLAGLSDGLRALGGELSIESRPGRGTSVAARLPKTARL
jgi:signal transduction histidine kinase